MRHTETERQTDSERKRDTERETETARESETDRETEAARESETYRDERDRDTVHVCQRSKSETDTQRDKQTELDRDTVHVCQRSKPHSTHLCLCLGSRPLHSTSSTECLASLPEVSPTLVLPLTSPCCCCCWSACLVRQKSRKPESLAFRSGCFISHLRTWRRERCPHKYRLTNLC